MSEFAHLHVHTQYSTLDGALKVKDLLKKVSGLGMKSVAITDHANMFGAIQLYKYAKEYGVTPIVGCEINVARDGRPGQQTQLDHLVLLAASEEGYRNLVKVVSAGHTHPASDAAPSVTLEKVGMHAKGIICMTACMGGVVQQRVLEEGPQAGVAVLARLREMFEPGSLFVELQDHGFPEQAVVNGILAEAASELELPLVASNDTHFKTKDDGEAQLYLQCIKNNRSFEEAKASHHGSYEMYLKSPDQMAEAMKDYPEAITNTLRVAEMCSGWKLKLGNPMLPKFPVPPGMTAEDYFKHVAREGLEKRFAEFTALKKKFDPEVYRARLEIEIGVICRMEFPGYFLIVWDFIRYGKENGVPVGPGRGSGAGSLVAYSMRITDLDPLPYDLLFERFLNPERVSMPDFDVDFCMDRRGKVIQYVAEKYGRESVGQIATFHELKARSVIKDVARAMKFDPAESAKIAALIPMKSPGQTYTLPEMIEGKIEPKFSAMYETDPRVKLLVDQATKLEGMTRHAGMHAAGVVISEGPLWDWVPVFVNGHADQKGPADDAVLVTQYYKEDVELAGLVKFDFLGLKTLTVLDIAVNLVRGRPDQKKKGLFDITAISLEDKETYTFLQTGDCIGVFQVESSGMQELFRKIRPDCFEDVVAAVALFRPGPLETGMVDDFVECKHGRQPIKKMHALIDDLLKPTYGVIVYQEQVMQIAQMLAGYSLGGADMLRRAMGKKKPEEMAKQKSTFVDGAVGKGVVAQEASDIFDLVEKFAGYGFNKCLPGESAVTDAVTGERTTVGELFRSKRPFKIHALGEDGKLRPRDVTAAVWNGRRRVFRLKTKLGKEIVATGNHPFRQLDGWTNLGDLRAGDRIAAPRRLDVPTTARWPEHEIITLAGLLAEGNTCHPSCLYFYNRDRLLIDDFARAAAAFPDTVARVTRRPDRDIFDVCVSTGRDSRFKAGARPWNAGAMDGNLALVVEPEELPARSGAFVWAERLGILGLTATEKRVPAGVFGLRNADIELFLGRLWAGDGFIANATQSTPFYATSSVRLARDVEVLLLRLGMVSTIHQKVFAYRGGERTGYTVHLVGEGAVEAFLERVAPHCLGRATQIEQLRAHVEKTERGLSSKDSLPGEIRRWVGAEREAAGLTWVELERRSGVSMKEFTGNGSSRKRGFRRATIARLAAFLDSERLAEAAGSDVFWDEVVSIEPAGVDDVYDLTVETDHNFVADGLVVHNSHSAAYALITYQTGYLKTHFPVELFCALMSADKTKIEKVVRMIAEARAWGVQVLPPDVNESDTDFKVVYINPKGDYSPKRAAKVKDKFRPMIRFGLGAVRGVSGAALESVFEARKEGPFLDLFDFAARVDAKRINRGVFEALVQCGAFDSTLADKGITRARAFAAIDTALERARTASKDRASGQRSMFDLFAAEPASGPSPKTDYPDVDTWDLRETLVREKQSLGFYVSGHPIDRYGKDMSRFEVVATSVLPGMKDWEAVKVAGMVESYKEKIPKGGKGKIALFDLEDVVGRVSVKARERQLADYGAVLTSGEPVLLSGKLSFPQKDEDSDEPDTGPREPTLFLNEARLLSDVIRSDTRNVTIRLAAEKIRKEQISLLGKVLRNNPGSCPVQLVLELGAEGEAILGLPELRVEPCDAMLAGLEKLFGEKVAELH
jgi:DNA polymerase III subunit alpha